MVIILPFKNPVFKPQRMLSVSLILYKKLLSVLKASIFQIKQEIRHHV